MDVVSTNRRDDLVREVRQYARVGLSRCWTIDPVDVSVDAFVLSEDGAVRRLLPLVLSALILTACGSDDSGSSTDCSLDGCTITFPRGEDSAEVSVLGVEARLDSVTDGRADLTVAGQDVSLDVGTSTEVGGLTVGVDSVSDTEVVVSLTR